MRLSNGRISIVLAITWAVSVSGEANAQCLAPLMPNDASAYAFSPFGVDRSSSPGASAGWHLGLDIQKPENASSGGSKTSPLSAPFTGTVTALPSAGGAGNMMVFVRPDGMVVEYMHMDRFAAKFQSAKGVPVTAGEYVGELGGTPHYGKHLHLGMKLPLNSTSDYRGKMYAAVPGAKSLSNQPFTAAKIASGYKPNSSMVYVDPQYWLNRQYAWVGNLSKYQSQGFQMAPGNKTFAPICTAVGGADNTGLQQQQVVNAMGGQNPATMTPAAMSASGIKDGDRLGVVDAPSYSSYADLSEQALIQIEAGRRMTDAGWDHQVTAAGSRGLTIEIARIRAAELFIQQRLEEKKKRVESLTAALLALRTRKLSSQ